MLMFNSFSTYFPQNFVCNNLVGHFPIAIKKTIFLFLTHTCTHLFNTSILLWTSYMGGWKHVWCFRGVCIFLLILFEGCTAVGKPQPSCCCSLYCLSFVFSWKRWHSLWLIQECLWLLGLLWHQTSLIAFFSLAMGRKDSLQVSLPCFLFFLMLWGNNKWPGESLLCVSIYVCDSELIHPFKCHWVWITGQHQSCHMFFLLLIIKLFWCVCVCVCV